MKTGWMYSLLILTFSLFACDIGEEVKVDGIVKDKVGNDDSSRVAVYESSAVKLTILIPDSWEVSTAEGRWAAKDKCSDIFCSNIVYYNVGNQLAGDKKLVDMVVEELKEVYSPSFELISTSPVYENPKQFSIAYAFGKNGISIVGYTFVVRVASGVHVFEVLDQYKNSDEVEAKLEKASKLCGSLLIKYS